MDKTKKSSENKLTVKQHINIILRGLKILASVPQTAMISKIFQSVFNAAVPFINIYFSARILNELAVEKNQNRLIFLVLLTIGLNLASMLIKSIISRWIEYQETSLYNGMLKVYTDKLFSMDYINIENPEVQQEFLEIRRHQFTTTFGLPKLLDIYNGVISSIIPIILSVAMAFSLFTLKVPANSPFAYLDSPAAVIIVILILSCAIFLSPYLSMIGGRIWAETADDDNKRKRLFYFYFFEIIGNDRGKDIRIYNQKRIIDKSAEDFFKFQFGTWEKCAKYNAKFNLLSAGLSYLSNGLIYLFVALKAFAGAFGVGGIVQYVGAITQFSGGFALFLNSIGALVNNNIFLDKTIKFLDTPDKKYQGTLSVEKRDDNEYIIEFCNVSFKYPGIYTYALKNLNLKFNIGQRMAVVGMNGSGKTTMIKLLCRLYDPTEGEITLNGIDIRKYKYDEYMALFSVVFQDFTLFPYTLAQNVAARIDYNSEKVMETLAKSGFNSRLADMPKGLETYLHPDFGGAGNGVELSSGEAQKVALARALYKDAPFIVLDEPTAALDPIAEFEIYSKFNDIVGDKTAIYISHRLSSCRFCDDIAVFHEGELIQRGSHDALIADENGKYYELWTAQAQYYAEK